MQLVLCQQTAAVCNTCCYTRAVVTARPQHCTQPSAKPGGSAYVQPGQRPTNTAQATAHRSTHCSTWVAHRCTRHPAHSTPLTLVVPTKWPLGTVCWHMLVMYTSVHTIRHNVQAKEGGQVSAHGTPSRPAMQSWDTCSALYHTQGACCTAMLPQRQRQCAQDADSTGGPTIRHVYVSAQGPAPRNTAQLLLAAPRTSHALPTAHDPAC
jgi:hypothetical protein